jgi:hypothetical protein
MAPTTKPPTNFLSLPPELRHEILFLTFDHYIISNLCNYWTVNVRQRRSLDTLKQACESLKAYQNYDIETLREDVEYVEKTMVERLEKVAEPFMTKEMKAREPELRTWWMRTW